MILPGPLWLGVVVPVRVPSEGQTDLFENYSYTIRPCAKKALKKQVHKNIKWMYN